MKHRWAAIALAGIIGMTGVAAEPAFAGNADAEESLVGLHANADEKRTGSGFVYTLNQESRRIRIIGLSSAQASVEIPRRIGNAVVDLAGFWDSKYLSSVRSITLPDTVTAVGTTTSSGGFTNGFANMRNLEHVTLTNAVTDLGNFTFYQDEKLEDVTLPEYLTKIGQYVFAGCSSMERVSVPTGVTSIGAGAFRNMKSLTTVYLPKSLKRVDSAAFTSDPSLTDIYYEGTEGDWANIAWGDSADEALKHASVHFRYTYPDKKPMPQPTEVLYRLYNPNSGEHFYTSSTSEKNSLVTAGWHDEGTAWKAPLNSNEPVYRLYNPNAGDHHYTRSVKERDSLVRAGWNYEGISWLSAEDQKTPVYRQYNPNAVSGAHNYTVSRSEADHLISLGWRNEAVGWYGE